MTEFIKKEKSSEENFDKIKFIFWACVPFIVTILNLVLYIIIGYGDSGYFDIGPDVKSVLLVPVVTSFVIFILTIIGIAKAHRYWKVLSIIGFIITLLVLLLSLFAYGVTS